MAFVERKIARIVQKEVMPELTKMINKQLQENRALLLEKIHEFPELIKNLVKHEVKKNMEEIDINYDTEIKEFEDLNKQIQKSITESEKLMKEINNKKFGDLPKKKLE